MHRKRLLTDWKMLCAFVLVLGIGCTVVYLRSSDVPYRFLEGHRPFYSKYEKWFGDRIEQHYYSWNGNYDRLTEQIWDELTPLGFKSVNEGLFSEGYHRSDGLAIHISDGMASTLEETHWASDWRPNGITVIVERKLPDNWLTRVRKWLQR